MVDKLNIKEADKIHPEDLEAAADMFDRIIKKIKKENNGNTGNTKNNKSKS